MGRRKGSARPVELLALDLFTLGKPVTPQEIDNYTACKYTSRIVSLLKTSYGFEFSTQKNGRNIITYTLTKEPPGAAALRAGSVAKIGVKEVRKRLAAGDPPESPVEAPVAAVAMAAGDPPESPTEAPESPVEALDGVATVPAPTSLLRADDPPNQEAEAATDLDVKRYFA